jgi:hypothetical protein
MVLKKRTIGAEILITSWAVWIYKTMLIRRHVTSQVALISFGPLNSKTCNTHFQQQSFKCGDMVG